jgi:GAF domain-containing protein
MSSPPSPPSPFSNALPSDRSAAIDPGLQRIVQHLMQTLRRDVLVEQTVVQLRTLLKVDRMVLYYFYRRWKGQVTFESHNDSVLSILGSTGADDCFNDDYAAQYLAGRIRAISDIEQEPIHECHRNFLRSIHVRSNLVVPVLTNKGLWGLLIAHQCQSVRAWSEADIRLMQEGAHTLANSPAIQDS